MTRIIIGFAVTNLEKDINEEAEVLAPKVPSEALPVCGTKDMVDVSAHEEEITNVEVAGPPMQLDGNRGASRTTSKLLVGLQYGMSFHDG